MLLKKHLMNLVLFGAGFMVCIKSAPLEKYQVDSSRNCMYEGTTKEVLEDEIRPEEGCAQECDILEKCVAFDYDIGFGFCALHSCSEESRPVG